MRCHICDKGLSDKEGAFNKDLQAREPCSICLEIAMDAAYSDGYSHDDDHEVVDADFDEAPLWAFSPITIERILDE